jgi:SAM-dependent methyltransferase
MDAIYQDLSLDAIPWHNADPPDALVELVESRWVSPSTAIDLGCGAGHHAIWLATRGFQVTGLDLSPAALGIAERLAAEQGVRCRFIARDLTTVVDDLDDRFDFAYDWQVLHHVFPADREQYVANVHRLLRSRGKYLSVCFSEDEPASFGGEGKYRTTPLGTVLYFSSAAELRELFAPHFDIEQLCTIELAGKHGPHLGIKALLSRRDA